jgi:hypothetical protein
LVFSAIRFAGGKKFGRFARANRDYQAWRDDQAWHAAKQAKRAADELPPSQRPNTTMRCVCGELFDSHNPAESLPHRKHIHEQQTEIRRTAAVR